MPEPDRDDAAPPPGNGFDRVLALLIAGQIGMHAAMAGLRMAAPLQALREGHSAWSVGVLLALFAAAPVLLALGAGRMADRHGYHRPVRIAVGLSLAGLAVALASTPLAGSAQFALLCVAATLSGAGSNVGLIVMQRTASVRARDGVERVRMFSWIGMAPSLANVVGPVAAGLAIDLGGFAAAYALLLALPLGSAWCARRVPAQPPAAGPAARRRGGAFALLATPGFKRLLFVNWLLSSCWDVHSFAVPVLGNALGFNASSIGLILGVFTLAVTGVRLLIPLLAHRLREVTVVRAAMLATAAVFAAYPLTTSPWAMAGCAVLLGIALGAVQPMLMSTLHRLTPAHRHGEAIALRSMSINAASTLMPLAFGAAGAALGVATLFWVMGAAVGAGNWSARGLGAPAPDRSAAA